MLLVVFKVLLAGQFNWHEGTPVLVSLANHLLKLGRVQGVAAGMHYPNAYVGKEFYGSMNKLAF